jgi:hypothetical protein
MDGSKIDMYNLHLGTKPITKRKKNRERNWRKDDVRR